MTRQGDIVMSRASGRLYYVIGPGSSPGYSHVALIRENPHCPYAGDLTSFQDAWLDDRDNVRSVAWEDLTTDEQRACLEARLVGGMV